jgi:hypothetical protein
VRQPWHGGAREGRRSAGSLKQEGRGKGGTRPGGPAQPAGPDWSARPDGCSAGGKKRKKRNLFWK